MTKSYIKYNNYKIRNHLVETIINDCNHGRSKIKAAINCILNTSDDCVTISGENLQILRAILMCLRKDFIEGHNNSDVVFRTIQQSLDDYGNHG